MAIDNLFQRLRGALGNALVWGGSWGALALAGFSLLHLAGLLPERVSWLDGLGMAVRLGVAGVIAGGAFSGVIRLLYRGRRLSEISSVRFGIAGGVVAGLFVPLFLETMSLLTGGGFVPLALVTDDAVITAVLGGLAAGASLKLAQRAAPILPGGSDDRSGRLGSGDGLASTGGRDGMGHPVPEPVRSGRG